MKKILLIAVLISAVAFIACDRQKALDRIMADPQMKSYILNEAMKDVQTRAALADSIFADKTLTDKYLEQLIANESTRSEILNRMLQADSGGVWIIGRLSENPELKAKMRELPR